MSEELFQSMFESTMAKAIIALLIFSGLLIIFLITDKKSASAKPRALTFSAIAIAFAFVLNQITLFQLPQGGAITPLSMLFIVLVGYFFGLRQGLLAGICFGLLDLMIHPYVISPIQMLVDYPLAFGALGLSGLLRNRDSVIPGYLLGVSGRFVFSFLSGLIFFGMYAPEGFSGFTWSLVYNGSYLLGEAVLTVIVLAIPAVGKLIRQIKLTVTE
ncbi:energy-coupled thiamine transporter ThiT [Eubacteriaceae bacterium ES2]|nr:energy-coupled thiamine transporter ThiT [Eubacteriaceae bacterium ES2]